MFSQKIKEIYEEVRRAVEGNTMDVGKDPIEVVVKGRPWVLGITQQVEEERFNSALSMLKELHDVILRPMCPDAQSFYLGQLLIDSTFAQAYGKYDCIFQSSIVFAKLLEQKLVHGSIEQINIGGKHLQKPTCLVYKAGEDRFETRYCEGHSFVIWGRSATSNLKDISSWSGLCDPWCDGLFWDHSVPGNATPTWGQLSYGYFVPTTFSSLVRMERNLTSEEWLFFANRLEDTKTYLHNNFTALCKKHNHQPAPGELERLESFFTQKIQEYRSYGRKAPEEKTPGQVNKVASSLATTDSPLNSNPALSKMIERLRRYRKDVDTKGFFDALDAKQYNEALRIAYLGGSTRDLSMAKILVHNRELLKLNPLDKQDPAKPSAFELAAEKPEFYKLLSEHFGDLQVMSTSCSS